MTQPKKASLSPVPFIILVAIFTWLISFPVAGAVQVSTVSPDKSASPGELVTVVFSVENTGSEATFDLELDSPDGWIAIGGLAPLTIDQNKEKTAFITIRVPSSARAGDYSLEFTATSQSDSSITDSSTTTVAISQRAKVDLEVEQKERRKKPGKVAQFKIYIENNGNIIDRFELEVESSNRWPVTLSKSSVELLPGEESSATIEVSVPETAEPGSTDWVSLTATSQTNREVSTTLRLATNVLPPEPEAVGKTLYSRVPARIDTTFDLSGGGNEREADFSMGGEFVPGIEFDFETGIDGAEELTDPTLQIEYEDLFFGAGSVGVSSGFASISGTGLEADTTGDLTEEIYMTLDTAKTETGAGITTGLYFDPLDFGFGFINDTVDEQELSLSSYSARLGVGSFWIDGQYGYGQEGEEEGSAYRIRGFSSSPLHALSATYRRGDPNFPGSPSDIDGFSISSRLNPSEDNLMTFGFQHSQSHDNVNEVEAEETVSNRSTRISFDTDFEDTINISASLAHETRESTDSTEIDEERNLYSLDIRQSMEDWSYSVFYDGDETNDYAADSNFFSTVVGTSLGIQLDKADFSFRVSTNTVEDLDSGLIEDRSWSTGLGCTYTLNSTQFSASASRTADSTGVGFNYTKIRAGGLETTLGANMSTSDDGYSASFTIGADFNTPVKLARTKGQVEGKVFVDENENGRLDNGEGVEDLLLKLNGSQAVTGDEGKFVFPPVWPGSYEISITNIPTGLEPKKELPEVDVNAGERKNVTIPLRQFSVIGGVLFNDENKDGKRDAGELGIEDVLINLSGGVTRKVRTNQNGRFSFQVPAGNYSLSIAENTLPDRFTFTTDSSVQVDIASRERKRINFGGYQEPRPVLFSPTATFAYSPDRPKPGQTVEFDASESYDPDGSIQSYEWEFGDGTEITTKEARTEHEFDEPGTYTVTLALVDNDGQRGTTSREVVVKEK